MQLDLTRWLPEFPVRDRCLYLDHAAICPLPRPVAEAMRRRIEQQERAGHLEYESWVQQAMACRHLGAQLVGAAPDDVIFAAALAILPSWAGEEGDLLYVDVPLDHINLLLTKFKSELTGDEIEVLKELRLRKLQQG